MPYIKQDKRPNYDELIDRLILRVQADNSRTYESICGDLNYIITRLVTGTYDIADRPSYSHINEVIGILECCKLEVYRRRASEYENQKMRDNGDVK